METYICRESLWIVLEYIHGGPLTEVCVFACYGTILRRFLRDRCNSSPQADVVVSCVRIFIGHRPLVACRSSARPLRSRSQPSRTCANRF